MTPVPETLQKAIEWGELSEAQLRELIALEAESLGLTFEEAVARARQGCLPKNYIGTDLELLIDLLSAA